MPDIKTKVSLYFPKDLFNKFEKLRCEKEEKLGVSISKNEFALKLISDAIDNMKKGDEFRISESGHEYSVSGNDIRMIREELSSLRDEVDQLKKENRNKN